MYPLTLVSRRQARLAATRAQAMVGPQGPAWLDLDLADFLRLLWSLRGSRPGGVRVALMAARVTSAGELQLRLAVGLGGSSAGADAAGGPSWVSFLLTVTVHPLSVSADPGRRWA